MKKYAPNPETGFLETKRSHPSKNIRSYSSFTAEKKQQFLSITSEYIRLTNKFPRIHDICDELSISIGAFEDAKTTDTVFKKEWNNVTRSLLSLYTNKLADKAEKDSGVIANLAILKYLETGSFVDRLNVKQTVNFAMNKTVIDAINVEIDPEIPPYQSITSNQPIETKLIDTQPIESANNTSDNAQPSHNISE